MSFKVGIGIITYNRREILNDTINAVRAFTRQPDAALVVADDGSTDGTLEMLRDKQVPVITGTNMGVAWNKNRALFLLSHILACEVVILLEDDTRPAQAGWEAEWIQGVRLWGHVNYAAEWMRKFYLSGAGTVADPVISARLTAQCAAYSATALTYGGYFDPRFRGFGHEHIEHSHRLLRSGYGGTDVSIDGERQLQYVMLTGGVIAIGTKSYSNSIDLERNLQLAHTIMAEQGYRSPWGKDDEMRQFRSEIENTMTDGPDRFRLTGPSPNVALNIAPDIAQVQQVEPGFLSRLLQRS